MSEDTRALLQIMHAQGLGARTLSRILRKLASDKYPLAEFILAPISEMTNSYQLRPEVAESIKNAHDQASEISDQLERNGIVAIAKESKRYPKKLLTTLKNNAPPVLFAHGNLDILDMKSVGFCGSRKASEKGIKIASECSNILAKKGFNIVSGYAHGVDTAAHHAALNANGITTIVLATGILHFKRKSDVSDLLNSSNHLVISEFLPRIGWMAHNAMQRNLTICGLSDAMIVIESGLEGGTFEAGKAALKLNCPLFVMDYDRPPSNAAGNKYLIEKGARAIRRGKDGFPKLEEVLDAISNTDKYRPQTSFFSNL